MSAEVLQRVRGVAGELVLRREGDVLQVISDGVFLMDTRDGRSERLLVRETVAASAAAPARVLVGGLGVGFSLLEALSLPDVGEVVVSELEPQVVRWHTDGPLREITRGAVEDARVRVVLGDVRDLLAASAGGFDAICLDTDNGPDWLVRSTNSALYDADGIALAARALAPGGALGVWSAGRSAAYEQRLRAGFATVARHETEVARGEPDVVWVARSPR
ncbi:spermine/spermidine synthase domain-containing protein [Motilibacter peucedani]|uniref:spermine/spermidine synthase domain-containing protein n=1 Tax=Motilibacter peucedani TaxID=598650 RepID=UPI000EAFF4B4|nr:spermidine synthase [Motilibacter peucedani]